MKLIKKNVKNVKLLYYGDNEINKKRAKEIEKVDCETKIYPTKETLPISTVVIGDKVINAVWGKEPLAFKIENKTVADSLRANFELLWNQDTRIVKGLDSIQDLFDDMLNYDHVDLKYNKIDYNAWRKR